MAAPTITADPIVMAIPLVMAGLDPAIFLLHRAPKSRGAAGG
jgi:hypothetical protein